MLLPLLLSYFDADAVRVRIEDADGDGRGDEDGGGDGDDTCDNDLAYGLFISVHQWGYSGMPEAQATRRSSKIRTAPLSRELSSLPSLS